MKKMKIFGHVALIAILLFTSVSIAKADSPLTSTNFYLAYTDLPTFATNEDMYAYLADESNPVDYRLAVVNRSGWDVEGTERSEGFLLYLAQKYGFNFEDIEDDDEGERMVKRLVIKMPGKTLACLAYLMALDDYFDVDGAMGLAEVAVIKEPQSYSVNIIAALIKAQKAMDEDWKMVYKYTDDVRKDTSLFMDMKQAAIDIIFEYQDLYNKY